MLDVAEVIVELALQRGLEHRLRHTASSPPSRVSCSPSARARSVSCLISY
jgi:hypothetical protein